MNMPNNKAQADFVTDWEATLTNCRNRAAELPDLSSYIVPLETLLAEAKVLTARKKSLRGVKQQETLDLQEVMSNGREAAIRLRAALKAHYGPKSERLIEFGMRPLRKRVRKPEAEVKPKPVEPASVSEAADDTAK
jgi:hypothetical protein